MKILVNRSQRLHRQFIVEEALKRGFETWAAVRKGSSRRYLQDSRIRFVELDFDNPVGLRERLSGIGFDYVVHAAGATKCLHASDFFRINTQGTKNLAAAVAATCPGLRRFVFISSLSVSGPVRETVPYTDITAADTPRPDTAYGRQQARGRAHARRMAASPS